MECALAARWRRLHPLLLNLPVQEGLKDTLLAPPLAPKALPLPERTDC